MNRTRPKQRWGHQHGLSQGKIRKKYEYFPLLVGVLAGLLLLLLGARMVRNEETAVTADLARDAKEAARGLAPRIETLLGEDAAAFASGSFPGESSTCFVSTALRPPQTDATTVRPARATPLEKEDDACKALALALPSASGTARKRNAEQLVRACPRARGALGTMLVPGLLAEAGEAGELRSWFALHRDELTTGDRRYLHTLVSDAAFDAPVRRELLTLLRRAGEKTGGSDLSDRTLAAMVDALVHERAPRSAVTLRGDATLARALPSDGVKPAIVAVLDASELVRCAHPRVALSADLDLRVVDAQERDRETTLRVAPELMLEVVIRSPDVVRVRTRRTKILFGSLFALAVLLGGSLTAFLARRGRRAEELAELRTDFAAAIAHELRTPLTSMRVLAELLAEGSLSSEDHREAATNLLEQTERLSATAERMLTLRSLMVGKRAVALAPTPLAPLLETAVHDFSARTPHASVGRDFAVDAEALTDTALLRIVVDNFMDNASKYAGGPKEVYVRAVGESWEIGVVDGGPGVPDSMKDKLFEPFERAEARLSEETKGAGLGLALVRYAADAIGAEVGILDADPKGAIFYVRIPRRPEAVRTVSDEEGA
ncbi:MAG: HAMP domain-containing sensor histidine kinase [Polyangiaceae bacterium]